MVQSQKKLKKYKYNLLISLCYTSIPKACQHGKILNINSITKWEIQKENQLQ